MGAPAVRKARLSTGVTLSYLAQGDPSGPTVLLLHPWCESRRCFDRLLGLLPSSWHVLAVDQRGHGEADKPSGGYGLASLAADVTALLDSVGVDAAVLLGSSSGGYVAQQVAVAQPRRVRGLVLVGAPRSLRGRPAFADAVEALTDPLDPVWVRDSLAWFPRVHDVPEWYLEDRVRDALLVPARVWRDALAGLLDAVPPTEAGAITTPALVLWGEHDDLLPRADAAALAAAIPGASLVFLDTGHAVLWERPDRVADEVIDFVDGLSAST